MGLFCCFYRIAAEDVACLARLCRIADGRGFAMLSWLPRGRARNERIDADAEALIHDFGIAAYSEARRREHEASSEIIALVWGNVALAVARRAGSLLGQDTSIRAAVDVVSAPKRDPSAAPTYAMHTPIDESKRALSVTLQPFRIQFVGAAPNRGPTNLTEVEVQVADVSAAIVAAANVAWPPRTIRLRILDGEGREVFRRQKSDRRKG